MSEIAKAVDRCRSWSSGEVEDRAVRNPAERLHMAEAVRMAEALVFASAEPVSEKQLAARLPDGIDVAAAMAELQQIYRQPRRQSGQGRRRLGLPHGRRPGAS